MLVDGMMAGFNEGMTGEDDLDSDAMEEEAERMSSLHKAAPGCVRTYKKPAGPEKIFGIAGGKVIEAEDRPEEATTDKPNPQEPIAMGKHSSLLENTDPKRTFNKSRRGNQR